MFETSGSRCLGGACDGKVQELYRSLTLFLLYYVMILYNLFLALRGIQGPFNCHVKPDDSPFEELQAFLDQLVSGSRLLERHAGRFLFQLPPLQADLCGSSHFAPFQDSLGRIFLEVGLFWIPI